MDNGILKMEVWYNTENHRLFIDGKLIGTYYEKRASKEVQDYFEDKAVGVRVRNVIAQACRQINTNV